MSVFGSIMSKIFSAGESLLHPFEAKPAAEETQSPKGTTATATPPSAQQATASSGTTNPVDVEAVLTQMASTKGGGGNWKTSIVDLLKLLDLDSNLNSRKELGNELN